VAIINRLNQEVARITASAEVRKAWAAQGAVAMTMGVADFTRYVEADIVKWAGIVKISGAKVD
jgi:tripartite-type tricarboxylate transporter receptor subunit TctC